MWWSKFLLVLAFVPALVYSLAATDEIQDADPAQSGYLPNHNLHPSTVGSSIFGILWKNTYLPKELFYAKPLTYTPNGSTRQLVFLASAQNWIRTVDAINGTLINQRQVQPPFLQSDIGCTDIPNYIGIIGTPIIDPNTETVYFFSKGYQGGASSGGVALGQYTFYGVNINTLQDNITPVIIDGHYADNDVTKYFVGGTVLQRPSLTMLNGVVIGGFGGHCDLFNYTGMLVAVSTTPGVGVTSIYAMEGGPAAQPETSDIFNQAGGKAGIWQGGFGLATDTGRIFFATGNGQGHANGDIPSSGRTPLTTLDEVVADFGVSSAGKLSLTDYFEPYEYVSMDAGDRDLGSGGVALLDANTFKGTGVTRIAVSVGKNGKAYILNADNLGGFKQGSGGTDNILQTIIAQGSVFGGSGSYPLEGGYIYFTPIGFPTVCYKLGLDGNGKPVFTFAGQTSTNGAGRVGIGIPTITTYQGQAGTGILWVTDPSNGLQAFNAVPNNNATLVPINIPQTGGINKFQRPAFGDGRVYVTDTNANVYCFGSPVALPLNCTNPVSFGDLAIGSSATLQVSCTALIPITKINGCITGNPDFKCSNASLPTGALAQGATFTFPITWDLTQASINELQNSSFGKVLPGPVSTNLDILTTNGVPKYSPLLPISLSGNTVSQAAFLSVTPEEVDFGGLVVGGSGQASGLTNSFLISNIGSQTLTFTGIAWTDGSGDSATYSNTTQNADNSTNLGDFFSSSNFPAVPSTLSPGESQSISVTFNANQVGTYHTIVQFWSDGGVDQVIFAASASTNPIANISVSTIEGGWDFSEPVVMDFGNVLATTSASQNIRICNSGGSALQITKSKPPIDPELFAARPLTDLHEGQFIDVNTCAFGEVDIVAAAAVVNQPPELVQDVWTLNTDGINLDGTPFGVHEVAITAAITRRQVGPLLGDGTARYKYLGCYQDQGRILPKAYNGGSINENGYCQNACLAAGYRFAGTEYKVECWCGNTPPPATLFHAEAEKKCTFSCAGDTTQACGGNGGYISVFYDVTKYTPPNSTTITGSPATSTTSTSSSTSTTITTTTSTTSTSSTTSSTTLSSSTTTTSSSSPSTTTSTSTSTSTSSTSSTGIATQTGPIVVPTAGGFVSLGCYTEATGIRALSGTTFANDSLTVELCAAFCAKFTYMGVEYHRECYCGNTINSGSVPTAASGCVKTCNGNPLEYCGGSSKLNMYQMNLGNNGSSSSPSSSSSTTSTSSSSSSSSSTFTSSSSSTSSTSTTSISSSSPSSTSSSSSSPSSTSSSSSSSSTSSSSSSTSSSSTSSSSTSSSSSSTSTSSSSTSSISSSSSSSSTSTSSSSPSSTSSSSTSSTFSSSTSSSTSTSSTSSSSSSTSSSTTATTLVTTTTSTTSPFSISTASATPVLGFYAQGCYSDPVSGPYAGHNMPLLFRNDSVTPELCIAVALQKLHAVPATTFAYVGLEYGRECYAATAAPSPSPATVTGRGACTMTCKGNATESCGGSFQMNLYASPTATP